MTFSSNRVCQADGCTNELSPTCLPHKKFCNGCNDKRRKERLPIYMKNFQEKKKLG